MWLHAPFLALSSLISVYVVTLKMLFMLSFIHFKLWLSKVAFFSFSLKLRWMSRHCPFPYAVFPSPAFYVWHLTNHSERLPAAKKMGMDMGWMQITSTHFGLARARNTSFLAFLLLRNCTSLMFKNNLCTDILNLHGYRHGSCSPQVCVGSNISSCKCVQEAGLCRLPLQWGRGSRKTGWKGKGSTVEEK